MKKIGDLIKSLLNQGISAQKMAMALSIGSVIGYFPVLGTTTIISGVVALKLRLNMIAVQLANYLVYPLQFILIVPEIRIAHRLFFSSTQLSNLDVFLEMAKNLDLDFFQQFGNYIFMAIIGWAVISIPAAIVLYFIWYIISYWVLKKIKKRKLTNDNKIESLSNSQ